MNSVAVNGRRAAVAVIMSGLVSVSALAGGGIVAVDQAGYPTTSRKLAVTTVNADSFRVIDAATRQSVFRSAMTHLSLSDPATGLELWAADFTTLQKPGEYVVVASSGDSSQHFAIVDSVYMPVYRATLKGYYYQRCGMLLSPVYAGQWYRAGCHSADATFHSTAEGTGIADVTGGWHDAGDYGKYVVNAGITVGTLLMAYEWFPARFAADDLNIPESGNGVPDILDEARYELNWLLKMQRDDGGAFFKVTHKQFEGFVMPNQDTGVRYIYQLSSTATGDLVAMMARASRVYRPFDSAFAGTCLASALKGWQYLQAHPSIVPAGGFKNPSDTGTGEYGDGSDSDERLWAAAELYLANGDSSAHAAFVARYATGGIITSTMSWQGVKALAELAYLRGTRSGISTAVQGQIRQSLKTYCQSLLALHDQSGFGTALGVNDYYWGSNSQALNNALLLIMASEEGGNASFLQAALDQLHYVLGVNAHGQSFVTGLGGKHTMHPHHRPSGSDGIVEPVPGLVSGGPDRNVSDDPVLSAKFTRSTPPALCYVDDQGSYASNEICINWNAPLVFVAGYFARPGGTMSVMPSEPSVPRGMELRQNYPNPFNPSTVISCQLAAPSKVNVTVYDALGRRVTVLIDGELQAGEHRVVWDAAGLATGVYIARMEARSTGEAFVGSRSMLLLK